MLRCQNCVFLHYVLPTAVPCPRPYLAVHHAFRVVLHCAVPCNVCVIHYPFHCSAIFCHAPALPYLATAPSPPLPLHCPLSDAHAPHVLPSALPLHCPLSNAHAPHVLPSALSLPCPALPYPACSAISLVLCSVFSLTWPCSALHFPVYAAPALRPDPRISSHVSPSPLSAPWPALHPVTAHYRVPYCSSTCPPVHPILCIAIRPLLLFFLTDQSFCVSSLPPPMPALIAAHPTTVIEFYLPSAQPCTQP